MKTLNKISETISEALNNTDPLSSLETILKAADPEIQQYVSALAAENLKIQRKLFKCEAEKVTLQNRITLLEEQIEEEKKKPKAWDLIAQIRGESSE